MFMIVAGVVLSIGALQYEFKQGSSGEYTGQPVYEYGMLTPQEQHVVDGALNGKTYAFDSSESLPGASRFSAEEREGARAGSGPHVHLSNRLPGDVTERAGDHLAHRRRPAGDVRSGPSPALLDVVAVADRLRTTRPW